MAGRRDLFRGLSAWLWQRKLSRLAARSLRRQQTPWRRTPKRPNSWPSTAPGKSSPPANTAGWERLRANLTPSFEARVGSLAKLLNRCSPRMELGTRLVWYPWHRLKHRMVLFLLSSLIPVSFSGLLAQSSKTSMASRGGLSRGKPGKLEPMIRRWLVLILRQLCLWLLRS